MPREFSPGDFLIFQLESGYGLLRVLAIDEFDSNTVWHLAAYEDLFLDADMADAALDAGPLLTVNKPHLALTNRAFESTQVARMRNLPLTDEELIGLDAWRRSAGREVSDRSVRLLLGLR